LRARDARGAEDPVLVGILGDLVLTGAGDV